MSRITIGKTEYEVTEELLDQQQLLFYEDNPRVYSILRADGSTPTQGIIEEKMTSMEHVKKLRLSIEQNGGLIDPLVVVKRNDDHVVLEGNSRLAAYRLLAKKDPIKWQKIRVNLLPTSISDSDIFTLLGQYHLVGRKDWSVFEQAAYLYRQKQCSNVDNSILAKNVGLTEGKVNAYISVYQFMVEHDDLKPDRWSYYEEYLKSRGIKRYRETTPRIDEVFVRQVKTGEIKQAMDVRTVLADIARTSGKVASTIIQDIIEGKTNIYKGHDQLEAAGKTGTSYKKLKTFRDIIMDDDFQKAIKLEATASDTVNFELKKIRKAIEKLCKELNL